MMLHLQQYFCSYVLIMSVESQIPSSESDIVRKSTYRLLHSCKFTFRKNIYGLPYVTW